MAIEKPFMAMSGYSSMGDLKISLDHSWIIHRTIDIYRLSTIDVFGLSRNKPLISADCTWRIHKPKIFMDSPWIFLRDLQTIHG